MSQNKPHYRYIYHGDKLTDPKYKKALCSPVLNSKGNCIRGRNSNMLVVFESGERCTVLARCLRFTVEQKALNK